MALKRPKRSPFWEPLLTFLSLTQGRRRGGAPYSAPRAFRQFSILRSSLSICLGLPVAALAPGVCHDCTAPSRPFLFHLVVLSLSFAFFRPAAIIPRARDLPPHQPPLRTKQNREVDEPTPQASETAAFGLYPWSPSHLIFVRSFASTRWLHPSIHRLGCSDTRDSCFPPFALRPVARHHRPSRYRRIVAVAAPALQNT